MKLSLLTYNLGREMDMATLIEVVKKYGYEGIEFRAEQGHKHGVEIERSKEERKRIKKLLEDANIKVSCIATSCEFYFPEEAERKKNIERAKKFIELAGDVGASRIRVFGDKLPEGISKDETIKNVGLALKQLGNFAQDYKVDVLLEMHGAFHCGQYALRAAEIAGSKNVALVHNCDSRELVGGSIKEPYRRVKDYIRHVHIHDLENKNFPYKELFQLLKDDAYQGYLSLEVVDSPDAQKVAALYAALYRELINQLR